MRKRLIGFCPFKLCYDPIWGFYEIAIFQLILVDDEGIYTPSLLGMYIDPDNYISGKYIFFKHFKRQIT